tara:strand:- start:669 stop:1010 length:342 start_codon:yes stop_codon:yes gene_type:complete
MYVVSLSLSLSLSSMNNYYWARCDNKEKKKREKEREREKKKRHPYGCTHPHAPLFYIPSRYIFVTVRSTSIVKKGAQSMMKKCALFSLIVHSSCPEKEEKRKRIIEKSSKKED